ncbi:hypothetical protein SAMN04488003_11317 [Loktanella fryxellensis]|uniref:17 kDa surface antigen n=1 Tax=Loktanella fryxellensis TaxID=245187 RepID=A0A1H8FHD5_9RHOB|nr:hypothetical protein [Loktanella fryxellensis]SEN31149.1 hypothetical protein SAMN04488003_11317 [Loktanella fryxellensis]
MFKTSWILAPVAALALSACAGVGDTDLERGVIGAGGGLVAAEVLGTDPTATAIAGVAAGLLCDDAGICRPAR